jgi:cell wall-associated NlpC family hydrolase
MLRAVATSMCLMLLPLLPFAAHADDDPTPATTTPPAVALPFPPASAAKPADTAKAAELPKPADTTKAPPERIGLVRTVSASVQSAADIVLKSAQDVTDQALDLIGVRYKFGGQTPDKGLDCSGLVKYVFEQVTGVSMPRSAREQARVGEQVDREDLQPGDLVFFNTRRAAFSHVGIYLGDNEFVHAPRKKSSVKIANIDGQYWKKRFIGARRLIGIMPGMVSIAAAKAVLKALPQADDDNDDQP